MKRGSTKLGPKGIVVEVGAAVVPPAAIQKSLRYDGGLVQVGRSCLEDDRVVAEEVSI